MTGRTIDELKVGDRAELQRHITRETVQEFVRATGDDNAHDTRLAHKVSIGIAIEHRCHQPGLDLFELEAWITQAGNLDNGMVADMQQCARREAEQVYTFRGDILAHLPCRDLVAGRTELIVQFGMNQVDLA